MADLLTEIFSLKDHDAYIFSEAKLRALKNLPKNKFRRLNAKCVTAANLCNSELAKSF